MYAICPYFPSPGPYPLNDSSSRSAVVRRAATVLLNKAVRRVVRSAGGVVVQVGAESIASSNAADASGLAVAAGFRADDQVSRVLAGVGGRLEVDGVATALFETSGVAGADRLSRVDGACVIVVESSVDDGVTLVEGASTDGRGSSQRQCEDTGEMHDVESSGAVSCQSPLKRLRP